MTCDSLGVGGHPATNPWIMKCTDPENTHPLPCCRARAFSVDQLGLANFTCYSTLRAAKSAAQKAELAALLADHMGTPVELDNLAC